MELSVSERLILLSLLPTEGDFVTLKIVRALQGELSFSEEEVSSLDLITKDGSVLWTSSKEVPKDVPIGNTAMNIIIERLKALNATGKLTFQHMGVYERFVGDG